MLDTTRDSTMGMLSIPDWTADVPFTPWNQSGRAYSMEIMAPARQDVYMAPKATLRCLIIRGGIVASSFRQIWTPVKDSSSMPARTKRAIMRALFQV